MRITLHIGPDRDGALALQAALDRQRAGLCDRGILIPRSPGRGNHTRLYMALSDPRNVDLLRFNRGAITYAAQAQLRDRLIAGIDNEITRHRPDHMVLSALQLGTQMHRRQDLERLRALLARWSDRVDVLIQLRAPSQMLLSHYAWQISEGRQVPLSRDLALMGAPGWWDAALDLTPAPDPMRGIFSEIQGPPFWIDTARLVRQWGAVFGPEALRVTTPTHPLPGFDPEPLVPALPSPMTLARQRLLNVDILRLLADGTRVLPRTLWNSLLREVAADGPAVDASDLVALDRHFDRDLHALARAHAGFDWPGPPARTRKPDSWDEPDPGPGYRPTQYLAAARPRIERASRTQFARRKSALDQAHPPALSPSARRILNAEMAELAARLAGSDLGPRIVPVTGDAAAVPPALSPTPTPPVPGATLVACVKDEAPYLPEWLAHHRAIGFDRIVIYSNSCSDGTDRMLDRLQQLGLVVHRHNDDWQGQSPQTWALRRARRDPAIAGASWIAHIDVDEFINIRAGQGHLADLIAALPGASHIAMTWRLFGAGGLRDLGPDLVTERLTRCAPAHCPKPHTAWGFKTLFRDGPAYARLGCHRPTRFDPARADGVRWVNGSGRDVTQALRAGGWRSTQATVGYDLVQLNHYPLRGAHAFLVKRRRGRALHVNRQIGLAYWIRNDWTSQPEQSIRRGRARLRAALDDLLADAPLATILEEARAWHARIADELRSQPDFARLYEDVTTLALSDAERAAHAIVALRSDG
ncbi:MAG: glycosyltransferase family 2 protein [Marinibacterium sp.]|nr:glycosyltransferase family 2 protein [Marinibacterium sp.]